MKSARFELPEESGPVLEGLAAFSALLVVFFEFLAKFYIDPKKKHGKYFFDDENDDDIFVEKIFSFLS